MNDPLAWYAQLSPRAVSLRPRGLAMLGPPSVSGRSVATANDAGYWELYLAGIPISAGDRVRELRSLVLRMSGGARSVMVPLWDHEQAPWPLPGGRAGNLRPDEAYSDGTFHTDGRGFLNPRIVVTLSAAAALRATTIAVTVTTAGTIKRGMIFSLGEHAYAIADINDAGGWEIFPPLRSDFGAGAELNFDRPVCRMAVISPDQGDLLLDYGRFGTIDLVFREYVPADQ